MSKQDYITGLISNAEVDSGIIEQSLYDFLVESLAGYFSLSRKVAKREVTQILKQLFIAEV